MGPPKVETIYFNGNIRTLDAASPLVEALSVGLGRIVETGSSSGLLAGRPPGVPAIDLRGRTVLPGFTDAHAHFVAFADQNGWLDLDGTTSLREVLDLVAARSAGAREGDWILGKGWDQNDWPHPVYPDKAQLDSAAPNNFVLLTRVCGHAVCANSRALRLAGITRDTPDPPGGRIVRDSNGEPTGILLERAIDLVFRLIPPPTRGERATFLVGAAARCLEAGLVGVHDMGVSSEDVSLYRELFSNRALPVRITAYLSGGDPGLGALLETEPLRGFANGHLSVVGVKYFADGSLGARSAALLSDYADDPGNRGIFAADAGTLYGEVLRCHRRGFQAAVHAIGDAAVREVLDIYERVLRGYPSPNSRHRVEHAQVVSDRDIPRFASLGIIPSVQFIHCPSDMAWVEARLGHERLRNAYTWRSFIRTGGRIAGGSDFPVESLRPLLGIHAAVTRTDASGKPEGGWLADERLTIEEAVRAFTIDAAYAAHGETDAGSLTPGKRADCVILSDDIFSVEPRDIPKIEVLATIVGGEIVYRSSAL
jgi:predicted amidohydrolase YtcJ